MISLLNNKSNPEKQKLDQLTYRQRSIIDTVEYFRQKGLCYISQISLGEKLGVSRETINRDISQLKDMGLLTVQHRYNNSNYTMTTSWFRRPEVQNLLPYYFSNFRVIMLPLTLLSSSCHTSIEVLRFNSPSYPSLSYEGVSMGEGRTDKEKYSEEGPKKDNEVSIPEASHIKKICLALQRRGSTITNEDALKLLAYPSDVHERASKRFKIDSQRNIKDPLAYYLFICKDIASQDGRRADWKRVNKLREEGFVLLEETLHGATSSPSASSGYVSRSNVYTSTTGPQKMDDDGQSYSEYVKQEQSKMANEASARKTKSGPLAEEVLGWHKTVVELQRRVKEGDIGARWTLPQAEAKLKYLISQYTVDEVSAPCAKEQAIPILTSDFKTPASILSSPAGSTCFNKVESVTLKYEPTQDIWAEWKEYDPMLEDEEYV